MATPEETAAEAVKKAQRDEIKNVVKEAITEWQTDAEKARTDAAAKNKPKSFFDGLFS